MKICPNCQAEVEDQFDLCWNCNYSFSENQVTEIQEENTGERDISCLRCATPMRHMGRSNFQEGFFSGLLSNWESFDLYVCPKCDKVEFFAPKGKSLFGML